MARGIIRRRKRRTRPRVRRAASSSAAGMRLEAKQNMSLEGGLIIGGQRDPAEKSADQMADRVMRMTDDSAALHDKGEERKSEEKVVKRASEEPDKEEKVQTKPMAKSAPVALGAGAVAASPDATKAIRSMGAGKPLSRTARNIFEPRLGADLSSVRIHDGAAADQASKGINARAFTLGNDIAFSRGEYSPDTHSGRHLMAHELAHVTQDSAAPGVAWRKIQTNIIGSPNSLKYKLRHDYGVKGVKRSGNDYTVDKAVRSGSINKEIASSMLASGRTFSLEGTGLYKAEANLRDHLKARRAIISMAKNIRVRFSVTHENILSGVLKFIKEEAIKQIKTEILGKPDFGKKPAAEQQRLIREMFIKNVFKLLRENAGNDKFKKAAALVLKKSRKFDKSKVPGGVEPFVAACFMTSAMVVYGAAGPLKKTDVVFNPKDALRSSAIWSDWVPGDWGFIQNVDPAPKSGEEGENIVYIGKNKFWAHFPGSTGSYTLTQLTNMVAGWNTKNRFILKAFRRYPRKGLK